MNTEAPAFFSQDTLLAPYTTFGIGGPAKWFAPITNLEEMQRALAFCHQNRIPRIILGKGSNCLFDDKGFNGAILLNKINFIEEEHNGVFNLGSGYSYARLGAGTSRKGWTGLEFASGIPGTVGGAIYMNAGANGCDTASVLIEAHYLYPDGTLQTFSKEDISFGYRHSIFQKMKGAIVSAKVQLKKSVEAKEKQTAMLAYRTSTQPYGEKSAGCVFRNPEGASAGALIDTCGLKGLAVGGAVISPQHANFIVNQGNASAQDVLELVKRVKITVQDQYGIDLVNEVCYVPFQMESE